MVAGVTAVRRLVRRRDEMPARQCSSAGGGARVVSVEESPFFAERTKRLLRCYNLLDRVSLGVAAGDRTWALG